MARRRTETLDDLLLRHGEAVTAFAKAAGVPAYTLFRLRAGEIETPRIGTITKLAKALGVDPARVRAACAASRAAASGK